jgi:exopolysaccharide biosynthesis polyprenyl glycosylphosphotransferase
MPSAPRLGGAPLNLNGARADEVLRTSVTRATLISPLSRVAGTPDSASGARRLHERRRRTRVYLAADTAMLALAAAVALVLAKAYLRDHHAWLWAPAFVITTLVVLELRGFYHFRLHRSPVDDLGRIFAATAIAAMVLLALRVVFGSATAAAELTARFWVFGTVFLGAGRAGMAFDARRARKAGQGGQNTLIIGAGSVGQLVAHRLLERPELGLRPIGYLDKEPMPDAWGLDGGVSPPVLGASWDLERVIEENDVEQVILSFSTAPHAVLLDVMRRCRVQGIEVAFVPRLFEEVNNRIGIEHLGGIPFLRAEQINPRGWQFAIKYALDRMLAAISLLVLGLPLLAIAAAVKLTSPGPVFFQQRRVGLDGKDFRILKFRTMRGDAAKEGEHDAAWAAIQRGEEAREGASPSPDAVPAADRRTPIGRVLRRLSIDELPQLLNVLVGDMSFVGPRPERTTYVRSFEQHVYRYADRHRVKSGLTGWAQVQGLRGQTSLADRVEWDNWYIENWSLRLDFKILLMTVSAVIGQEGAG